MQVVWKSIQCIYFSICITIHPIWWIIWRVNHVFTEVNVLLHLLNCNCVQDVLHNNAIVVNDKYFIQKSPNDPLNIQQQYLASQLLYARLTPLIFFARPKNPTFFYLNFSWQKVTTRNGLPHNNEHEISLCMEGEKKECISNRQSHTQVNGIRKLKAVLYYSKT